MIEKNKRKEVNRATARLYGPGSSACQAPPLATQCFLTVATYLSFEVGLVQPVAPPGGTPAVDGGLAVAGRRFYAAHARLTADKGLKTPHRPGWGAHTVPTKEHP